MELLKFKDYRDFLKNYIHEKRKGGRGELKKMAEATGIHATLLSQVLAGTKELSLEHGFEIGKYLSFTDAEKNYFIQLILKERAGTASLKAFISNEIEASRKQMLSLDKRLKPDRVLNDSDRAIFYSSWIYSAVRLYSSIGKGKTEEEICHRFHLERPKAIEVLNFLTETQLCIKDGSFYKIGPFHTHLESKSPLVVKHHTNWRLKAIQHLEKTDSKELAYTSSISLSKKDFDVIREMFVKTIKEMHEIVKDSPSEEIACITLDLFWIDK